MQTRIRQMAFHLLGRMVRLGLIAAVSLLWATGLGATESAAQLATASQLSASCSKELAAGHHEQAEALCQQALALSEATLGKDHPDVVSQLTGLAVVYQSRGNYARAEPLFKRSLSIYEAALSKDPHSVRWSVLVNASLNTLATNYQLQGAFEQAESLLKRALSMQEAARGKDDASVGQSLSSLAALYVYQGAYAQAEPLLKRALSIAEITLKDSSFLNVYLFGLASVYVAQTEYAQAEPLFQRALRLSEATLRTEPIVGTREVATILTGLATLYRCQKDYARAESSAKRALHLCETTLGKDDYSVLGPLLALAQVYKSQKNYAQAIQLLKRALNLQETALVKNNPVVTSILNSLAVLYLVQGEYAQAESLFRRVLSTSESLMGKNHMMLTNPLIGLALLYKNQGAYAQAEPLLRRALSIYETTLGNDHPYVTAILDSLASIALARHQFLGALPLLQRSFQLHENQLRTVVTEGRVHSLLSAQRDNENLVYGLLLESGADVQLQRLALTMSLLRKGRAADAGAATNRAILESLTSPAQRSLFLQWLTLRQQYERMVITGAGKMPLAAFRERQSNLSVQIAECEHALAEGAPQVLRLQPPQAREVLSLVARKLPPGSALLEVVQGALYRPQAVDEPELLGAPHYIALLLFPDERIVSQDLGEVGRIDKATAALLHALQSRVSQPQGPAQTLYQHTLLPLQPHLSGIKRLYLSLDGSLNLVPFAALHDGKDYLLRKYQFTYLTSGRDLLHKPFGTAGHSVIFADPDYQHARTRKAVQGQPVSAQDSAQNLYLQLHGITPLPGTRREADAVAPLLPGVKVLLGGQATEEALLGVHAPRVVHIATHGVFLADEDSAASGRGVGGRGLPARQLTRMVEILGEDFPEPALALTPADNPLIRSALLLSGAAVASERTDSYHDGVVTADVVRSMSLGGTQLVVLSACDTGTGSLQVGEGVYGLRRAFFVAGTETLVVSLWQVADEETGELMKDYYQKLKQGKNRVGALQQAMEEMAIKKPHPYYWAPFIALGRDEPLH